jgi:hypothetical protein
MAAAGNELKTATVSEEMAKKFATEKETPYTRWVESQGLKIESAIYQENLHAIELADWPARGGRGVFLNHDASRTSNDAYVCEIPPGKNSPRADSCSRRWCTCSTGADRPASGTTRAPR